MVVPVPQSLALFLSASLAQEPPLTISTLSCAPLPSTLPYPDRSQGCDNCAFLEMKDQTEHVNDFTTSHYEGFVAMLQPTQSWVAKYQRLVDKTPGMYAIDIFEDKPSYLVEFLKQHNIKYMKTTGSGRQPEMPPPPPVAVEGDADE